MLGADTHHPPEHPNNQMTSNTDIRCTVKKPRSALETDEDMHGRATTTSHQVMLPTIEMDKATVEGMKFDKSKEHEESNVTYTDRNMQQRKEESKHELMITRHHVWDINKAQTAIKRPRSAFETHETTHTLTTYTPGKSFQPSQNAMPSPIIFQVRSLNPTKLKLPSVQDQDDLTVTLAPQHMEKVHKDDSSDNEDMVKERKYEVFAVNRETDEVLADSNTIMGDFTHEDSDFGECKLFEIPL
jgi:hypothetical protein